MKIVVTPNKTKLLLINMSLDVELNQCTIDIIKNECKVIEQIKNLTDDDCTKWLVPDRMNGLYLLYNSEYTTDMWVTGDGNLNSLVRTEFVLAKESFLSFLMPIKLYTRHILS